jgi:Na+-transporting NADH:ubiquinone oxidoreductase subunit NqrB
LAADPVVFKGGDEHGPMLGQFWVPAYTFIALESLVLTLRLFAREHLGAFSGIVAGTLFAGSLVALALGGILLPLSLVGLLALIGALGFTPFLTSSVFFCNAFLALEAARLSLRRGFVAVSVALGFLLAFAVPCSIQSTVHSAWRQAVLDLADGDASAMKRVEFFYRFVDDGGEHSPMEHAIEDEHDPIRKERLVEGNRKIGF